MKKLVLVLLLFAITIGNAQEKILEKNIGISDSTENNYETAGIVVSESASAYSQYFIQALASPNQQIPVAEKKRFCKLHLFLWQISTVQIIKIVYDDKKGAISTCISANEVEEFSYMAMFTYLCVLSMLLYFTNSIASSCASSKTRKRIAKTKENIALINLIIAMLWSACIVVFSLKNSLPTIDIIILCVLAVIYCFTAFLVLVDTSSLSYRVSEYDHEYFKGLKISIVVICLTLSAVVFLLHRII